MSGFSSDGYIVDQDHFSAYPYHGMTSDINGCGWIAAYNLRHAAGQDAGFEEVCREMNGMYRLKIPGPTPMRVLRRYLRRYLSCEYHAGKRAAEAAAEKSSAGILRYWEGKVPHFITFVRTDGDTFRFFNVDDGLEEMNETMADFFRDHCHRGYIRVLTI